VNLTTHFTLEELVHSRTADAQGIPNNPDLTILGNLSRLCQIALEPVRALLGGPVRISSGYRCPALNAAVGGSATSAHMDGRAADLTSVDFDVPATFEKIRVSDVPYDQLIVESTRSGDSWVHLGIARDGEVPRRQALSASGDPGAMTYRTAEG
jgi:hypothetical protein